ncbi:MAG: hypothetical protein WDZ31_08910 [Phycisphaeraceae bacterium]
MPRLFGRRQRRRWRRLAGVWLGMAVTLALMWQFAIIRDPVWFMVLVFVGVVFAVVEVGHRP